MNLKNNAPNTDNFKNFDSDPFVADDHGCSVDCHGTVNSSSCCFVGSFLTTDGFPATRKPH